MAGDTFGRLFTVTTFGESHGPAIGCVVTGCPPRIALSEADIQPDLDRRRPGKTRHTSQRREADEVSILSGTFEGLTTGAPIALLIRNSDQRPKDYGAIKDKFRPGHADYSWWKKYGIRDHRGGGRSSARETAMRVAAGAIAKKYLLERYGVSVRGYVAKIGSIECRFESFDAAESNPFFCPNAEQVGELESFMDGLRKSGDSAGALIHVTASDMITGLGEPVFDRLDADIAKAMMSINAAKAVGVGAGFAAVEQKGDEHRDQMSAQGFESNNAGGVLGGVSTGQNLEVDVAFKPTSSLRLPGRTLDTDGKETEIVTTGRHDPCVGVRAVPICEAMLALVLADHAMRQRAQNFDSGDAPN